MKCADPPPNGLKTYLSWSIVAKPFSSGSGVAVASSSLSRPAMPRCLLPVSLTMRSDGGGRMLSLKRRCRRDEDCDRRRLPLTLGRRLGHPRTKLNCPRAPKLSLLPLTTIHIRRCLRLSIFQVIAPCAARKTSAKTAGLAIFNGPE